MAKKDKAKAGQRKLASQKRQVRLITGIVLAVVMAITAGVLFLNRGPKLADPAEFGAGVQVFGQVDINSAKLACSKFTRVSFGRRLKFLMMDDRSSRYEPKKDQFRVFMEGELYPDDGSRKVAEPYYFNCASSAETLSLVEYEIVKIEDADVKVGRKGKSSRYGWQ